MPGRMSGDQTQETAEKTEPARCPECNYGKEHKPGCPREGQPIGPDPGENPHITEEYADRVHSTEENDQELKGTDDFPIPVLPDSFHRDWRTDPDDAVRKPYDRSLHQPIPTPGAEDDALIQLDGDAVRIRCLGSKGRPGPGLVQGMAKVRGKIKGVSKTGTGEHYGDHFTHDDITAAIGPALAEVGEVWCFEAPVETMQRVVQVDSYNKGTGKWEKKPKTLTIMVVETVWTDGDSFWRSQWMGQDISKPNFDKAEYSLYSQILKYAYGKTLKVATGDDQPPGHGAEAGEAPGKTTASRGGSLVPMRVVLPEGESADLNEIQMMESHGFKWSRDDHAFVANLPVPQAAKVSAKLDLPEGWSIKKGGVA